MRKLWALLIALMAAGQGSAFESTNRSNYLVDFWDEALRRMGEPPLPALIKNDSSVFRALLDIDSENPVVFRIETFSDGRPAQLTHVIYRGGDGHPQPQKQVRQRDLTANELARLREAFARVSICGSPLRNKGSGPKSYVWVFEFANATRYCAIERWPDSLNDPSDMLGRLLEKLAR
jgi:hypothetical protein